MSGLVKFYNPATQFNTQAIAGDSKLDNVWVFDFVRERLSGGLRHVRSVE